MRWADEPHLLRVGLFITAPRMLLTCHTSRQKRSDRRKLYYRVCRGHNDDLHADHLGETTKRGAREMGSQTESVIPFTAGREERGC
jgi:hypothetical protein